MGGILCKQEKCLALWGQLSSQRCPVKAEADRFLGMVKHFVRRPASISIPPGIDETYELAAVHDRERFLLDVWRGTLELLKLKFQNKGANCGRAGSS